MHTMKNLEKQLVLEISSRICCSLIQAGIFNPLIDGQKELAVDISLEMTYHLMNQVDELAKRDGS